MYNVVVVLTHSHTDILYWHPFCIHVIMDSSSFFLAGSFRLYDINHDGYISRDEMISVVDSIYKMVVCNDIH